MSLRFPKGDVEKTSTAGLRRVCFPGAREKEGTVERNLWPRYSTVTLMESMSMAALRLGLEVLMVKARVALRFLSVNALAVTLQVSTL